MTLEEIKAAVEELDAAHKRANQYFVEHPKHNDQVAYNTGRLIVQPAIEKVNRLADDALHLLIPIAEAAKQLEPILNAGAIDYMSKEDSEALSKLLAALDKLKVGQGVSGKPTP